MRTYEDIDVRMYKRLEACIKYIRKISTVMSVSLCKLWSINLFNKTFDSINKSNYIHFKQVRLVVIKLVDK